MKLQYIFILIILCARSFVCTAQTKSEKRGVSQNGFAYQEEIDALEPGVTWYYNWANTPNSTEAPFLSKSQIAFYPMCWNASFNETAIRQYLSDNPQVKYLMGFNEPNFKAQANMTPAAAAAKWPVLEKIAEDFNLELVAPALNYSPDAPYHNPIDWYDEFFQIYPDAKADYLALHCYMITSDAMMNFIDAVAARYNKKIWLTEFCAWDELTKDPVIARQTQIDEMVRKVEALELSDNVAKYSWFKARGGDTYPYYSLLKYKNESQGIAAGTLTTLGNIYVNMSSFDKEHFHSPIGCIPASQYIKSAFITLEENTDIASENKLQIGNFGSGRSLEYQIETPNAGEYDLTLRIACTEEPFLPVIDIYSDNIKLATITPESTMSLDNWINYTLKVTLPEGKQRLIFKSKKSTKLRINWLSLDSSVVTSLNLNSSLPIIQKKDGHVFFNAYVMECLIFSSQGTLVKRERNISSIPVNQLTKGAYILTLRLEDGVVITEKIMI